MVKLLQGATRGAVNLAARLRGYVNLLVQSGALLKKHRGEERARVISAKTGNLFLEELNKENSELESQKILDENFFQTLWGLADKIAGKRKSNFHQILVTYELQQDYSLNSRKAYVQAVLRVLKMFSRLLGRASKDINFNRHALIRACFNNLAELVLWTANELHRNYGRTSLFRALNQRLMNRLIEYLIQAVDNTPWVVKKIEMLDHLYYTCRRLEFYDCKFRASLLKKRVELSEWK